MNRVMAKKPPRQPLQILSYDLPDAICSICGMRRSDPKHRGKRADRCAKIRQQAAQLRAAKPQ